MRCRNGGQYWRIFSEYRRRGLGEGNFTMNEIAGAVDFVRGLDAARGGLLACPVSRLQVRFRLGYRRACELAGRLEEMEVWEIVVTPSGMRGARLK
jgi:hypothetical protein